jgi:putative addiction module killer protein
MGGSTQGPLRPAFEIRYYHTADGEAPFLKWIAAISDHRAIAAVQVRLDRIKYGNFGDARPIGNGLSELRIHYGAGIRVYFGRDQGRLIILLCAGTKARQANDIKQAKVNWEDYREHGASTER